MSALKLQSLGGHANPVPIPKMQAVPAAEVSAWV